MKITLIICVLTFMDKLLSFVISGKVDVEDLSSIINTERELVDRNNQDFVTRFCFCCPTSCTWQFFPYLTELHKLKT